MKASKTVTGMRRTLARHKSGHSALANMLALRGTLDALALWHWNVARYQGSRISERGKLRLAALEGGQK